MSEFYIGEVRVFAGDFAPVGWCICDGRPLAIAEYEALYSLIGTTYGGDGRVAFNVPDLRGRLPVGVGQNIHTGSTIALGQKLGSETVTLSANEMPSHNHQLMVSIEAGSTNVPGNNALNLGDNNSYSTSTNPDEINQLNEASIQATGNAVAHENRMPTVALNYIIALQGMYPPQN